MNDEFKRIITAINALADAPRITAKRAELKIAELIDLQFDEGKDAYGNPWAPIAESTRARGRSEPALTDTGDMRKSVEVKAQGAAIVVSMSEPFPYHQAGTGSMPARPVLPTTDEVPKSWDAAVSESVEEVLKTFPVYAALRK